jgi:transposase-like protein
MADLKNRRVRDILIACTDGLTGFADAITSAFPSTVVQRCVVHYADLRVMGNARRSVTEPLVHLDRPLSERARALH